MVGTLLMRGMLAGLVAGLLAFGVAKVFGEPQVDHAIAFESSMEKAHSHDHGDAAAASAESEGELVSRKTQASWGLLTGVLVYGVAFGGIFALVFAYAAGRVGPVGPRALAVLLALGAFVVLVLVPDLKYPANPPAVGNPDTITMRTELFLAMLAGSVAAAIVGLAAGRAVAARSGAWAGWIAGGLAFIVLAALVQALLPDLNEVPDNFPAVVLWRFRAASLGIHVTIWGAIGLLFGWLTERSLRSSGSRLLPAAA